MPIFSVRAAWLRNCWVAWLLGCVAAGSRSCEVACVAAVLFQNTSAVFSYVEYIHLYSKHEKTAARLVNAWLLGCVATGLRGCVVAGLCGCCKILRLCSSLAAVANGPRQPVDLHHCDALDVTALN